MNREQLHEFIAQSTRNESNICQITALRDGKTVYEDCWHGYSTDDAVHVALGGQGDRAGDAGAGLLRGVDDLLAGLVDDLVIVALEADPDLLVGHCGTS